MTSTGSLRELIEGGRGPRGPVPGRASAAERARRAARAACPAGPGPRNRPARRCAASSHHGGRGAERPWSWRPARRYGPWLARPARPSRPPPVPQPPVPQPAPQRGTRAPIAAPRLPPTESLGPAIPVQRPPSAWHFGSRVRQAVAPGSRPPAGPGGRPRTPAAQVRAALRRDQPAAHRRGPGSRHPQGRAARRVRQPAPGRLSAAYFPGPAEPGPGLDPRPLAQHTEAGSPRSRPAPPCWPGR